MRRGTFTEWYCLMTGPTTEEKKLVVCYQSPIRLSTEKFTENLLDMQGDVKLRRADFDSPRTPGRMEDHQGPRTHQQGLPVVRPHR
jgi:hypothetical protein